MTSLKGKSEKWFGNQTKVQHEKVPGRKTKKNWAKSNDVEKWQLGLTSTDIKTKNIYIDWD